MKSSIVTALALGLGLAACEQESQRLPFEAGDGAVSRTVPEAGGTVSSAAGAAVKIPQGALSAPTEVKITPVAAPATATGASASGGFQLEPAGTKLSQSAAVELKFDRGVDAGRAWLATVVNTAPSGVQALGGTRVDLSTGIAQSEIGELGTLAVVIPDPRAVLQVQRMTARSVAPQTGAVYAYAATGTDSVVMRCGDSKNWCAGVSASASDNLLSKVDNAAAVYPRVDGAFRIAGNIVSGTIAVNTSVRVQVGSTAENVSLVATVSATESSRATETQTSIHISDVRYVVSGGGNGSHETISTLVISKATGAASISVSRNFQIDSASGKSESAAVSVVFPVQLHQ